MRLIFNYNETVSAVALPWTPLGELMSHDVLPDPRVRWGEG